MNLDALSLFPEPITNILVACIACGAFGGWIAHFINNEKQAILQTVDQRGWFLFPSNWHSALIGVADAIAFLFFIIAVGGLTTFSTLGEQIRIIAVSVIAGFGARSLLPRMVGQLEKQIAQAQKDVAETQRNLGITKAEAEQASAKADSATSEAGAARAEAEAALREATEALKLERRLIKK
jgi:hypothetical protein